MPVMMTVDELRLELKRQRQVERMTLRDVERATGVSPATLSRFERGANADPDILRRLADWLSATVYTGHSDHELRSD